MSATQQERCQQARSGRGRTRGDGYLDGLYGIETRRIAQPPDYRFAYDAGYRDDERARADSMEQSHRLQHTSPEETLQALYAKHGRLPDHVTPIAA